MAVAVVMAAAAAAVAETATKPRRGSREQRGHHIGGPFFARADPDHDATAPDRLTATIPASNLHRAFRGTDYVLCQARGRYCWFIREFREGDSRCPLILERAFAMLRGTVLARKDASESGLFRSGKKAAAGRY